MTQKEISNQEFNEKLNHSNFSFFENENNFPSNYGQKYKTCGKLRINKKLSPNSLYNDDFRLLCSEHHFKFTQKKNSQNNAQIQNQNDVFNINNNIGPNPNMINLNKNGNILTNEISPNIQIPFNENRQISDNLQINICDNGKVNHERNKKKVKKEKNKYITRKEFNILVSKNNDRLECDESRLDNLETRFEKDEARLDIAESRLQNYEKRLDNAEARLLNEKIELENAEIRLESMKKDLENAMNEIANTDSNFQSMYNSLMDVYKRVNELKKYIHDNYPK